MKFQKNCDCDFLLCQRHFSLREIRGVFKEYSMNEEIVTMRRPDCANYILLLSIEGPQQNLVKFEARKDEVICCFI